jgi:hypothetical protein
MNRFVFVCTCAVVISACSHNYALALATLYDDIDLSYPNVAMIIGDNLTFHVEGSKGGVQFPINGAQTGELFTVEQYTVRLRNSNRFYYPPSVEFTLRTDVAGTPGSPLDSFIVTGVVDQFDGSRYEVASSTHPIVTVGQNYWLTAQITASFTGVEWLHALNDGRDRSVAALQPNGTWYVSQDYTGPALRITGTYVPEPLGIQQAFFALFAVFTGIKSRRYRVRH